MIKRYFKLKVEEEVVYINLNYKYVNCLQLMVLFFYLFVALGFKKYMCIIPSKPMDLEEFSLACLDEKNVSSLPVRRIQIFQRLFNFILVYLNSSWSLKSLAQEHTLVLIVNVQVLQPYTTTVHFFQSRYQFFQS